MIDFRDTIEREVIRRSPNILWWFYRVGLMRLDGNDNRIYWFWERE